MLLYGLPFRWVLCSPNSWLGAVCIAVQAGAAQNECWMPEVLLGWVLPIVGLPWGLGTAQAWESQQSSGNKQDQNGQTDNENPRRAA